MTTPLLIGAGVLAFYMMNKHKRHHAAG
jgi:hypothetical protein